MYFSKSLQVIHKNAIIFYKKNMSKHSPPHELVQFHINALKASNKHNKLLGRTNAVDGVLTFMKQTILLLPTNA